MGDGLAAAASATSRSADAKVPSEMDDDLSTICPGCGGRMTPEHAHYRCALRGYRDTCCDGAPAQTCIQASEEAVQI